jgi:hypothetical protein
MGTGAARVRSPAPSERTSLAEGAEDDLSAPSAPSTRSTGLAIHAGAADHGHFDAALEALQRLAGAGS